MRNLFLDKKSLVMFFFFSLSFTGEKPALLLSLRASVQLEQQQNYKEKKDFPRKIHFEDRFKRSN